ncbi:hypothetical protein F5Y11DRAFT_184722 [Daldinia sp. FL1419]|nr:hypothetical protein F5Y11DRAFT_184722 [Daldinia sp. FL1419]
MVDSNNTAAPPYLRNRYNSRVREDLNRSYQSPRIPPTDENEQGTELQPMGLPLPPPPVRSGSGTRPSLPRERFSSVAGGGDPRANWSTSPLDRTELAQVFNQIGTALEHVSYAICGVGALVDHGFTARQVSRLSILCSAHAKDNVRGWLAASGLDTYADSVGVPAGEKVCRVRIKYLDEGFERLERVRSRISDAWVLGLASQLDHAAAGYVDNLRKKEKREQKGKDVGRGTSDDDEKSRELQALETIAGDIFWALDKAARTNYVLHPALLPTLLSQEFWIPFTSRYVDARPEFARAGIDVAAVLSQHSAEQAVKEHEDMLRSYGVEPHAGDIDVSPDDAGIITQQPRMFDGMHTLQSGRGIYTAGGDEPSVRSVRSAPSISGAEDSKRSSASVSGSASGSVDSKTKSKKGKSGLFGLGRSSKSSRSSEDGYSGAESAEGAAKKKKGSFSRKLGLKRNLSTWQ